MNDTLLPNLYRTDFLTFQGVNLSCICTDWMLESECNVPALKNAIAALTKSTESSESSRESIDVCIRELVNIKNECEKGMQYQVLAGKVT